MPIIKEMFAYCSVDGSDDEGVVGWKTPEHEWMPLVGADMDRMKSLLPLAKSIAEVTGKDIVLKRFQLVSEEKINVDR